MLKQGTTPFSGGQCSAHPFHRNQLWIIPPTCDPRFFHYLGVWSRRPRSQQAIQDFLYFKIIKRASSETRRPFLRKQPVWPN